MTLRIPVVLAIASMLAASPVLAQTAPAPTPVATEPAAPATPAATKARGAGCMKDRHAMS